jgi:uncharacterized protein
MTRTFYPAESFAPVPRSVSLLPFRFTRLFGKELLVNEAGEYLFAPEGTVQSLTDGSVLAATDLYKDLKAKHFLYDDTSAPLLDVLAAKIRTKLQHVYGGTKLHIFVVTLRCEHSCHYCQISRQGAAKGEFDMSAATADAALRLMFESPAQHLTLEMQGGEPLLNFDLIRYIVPRAKALAGERRKVLNLVVTTNLAVATDYNLRYLADEGVKASTSLDGPAFLHNRNRPRPGNDSYERAIDGIARARRIVGVENVAALMTTTSAISPYGFAVKTRKRTGYEMMRFLEFYKRGLRHILDINRSGYRLAEIYTQILLTKILTPYGTGYVDLQSPAGEAWNVLVYNYDGNVFASDESRMLAEMRDTTFRLGNVHKDTRRTLLTSDSALRMFEASCTQSLVGCSDCAFQAYCGADPIFHHATQGDMYGHRPSSEFCTRNMEAIKHMFSYIAEDDPETMGVFWAWITGRPLPAAETSCA